MSGSPPTELQVTPAVVSRWALRAALFGFAVGVLVAIVALRF